MEAPFVRSAYNYDRDAASNESGLYCEDASRAQQHMAEECDINTIVRRFNVTGQLPENIRQPTFDDFTEVTDFKTAMDAVAMAREAFEAMPADVRYRFHNDPQEFVEFCSDDVNREEAAKLGLVDAEAHARHLASLQEAKEKAELERPVSAADLKAALAAPGPVVT